MVNISVCLYSISMVGGRFYFNHHFFSVNIDDQSFLGGSHSPVFNSYALYAICTMMND